MAMSRISNNVRLGAILDIFHPIQSQHTNTPPNNMTKMTSHLLLKMVTIFLHPTLTHVNHSHHSQ
jgi:hypothetical protein